MSTSTTINSGELLARATERFEALGREVLERYAGLEQRARRVEGALAHANHELHLRNVELQRVRGELEALVQSLPLGVMVLGQHGEAQELNSRAKGIWASLAPADRARVVAGNASTVEFRAPTGSPTLIAVHRAPVRTPAGVPGETEVLLLEDRTDAVAMERKLRTLDKMAALGTLAAGLAHELRNPLSAVLGFADLLQRQLEPGSKPQRWAEWIAAGAAQCEQIIAGLLGFAQPQSPSVGNVEVHALFEEVLQQVRAELPAEQHVDLTAAPTTATFVGDRVQIRQALRNLVANAIQAQSSCARVRLHAEQGADGLSLCVCDGGPGVPEELRDRILEPFFTTRSEGTGLGLALTHTIARLHGGSLTVDPTPSPLGGALFRLTLPQDCPRNAFQ